VIREQGSEVRNESELIQGEGWQWTGEEREMKGDG
jgi:hypothetical protein